MDDSDVSPSLQLDELDRCVWTDGSRLSKKRAKLLETLPGDEAEDWFPDTPWLPPGQEPRLLVDDYDVSPYSQLDELNLCAWTDQETNGARETRPRGRRPQLDDGCRVLVLPGRQRPQGQALAFYITDRRRAPRTVHAHGL